MFVITLPRFHVLCNSVHVCTYTSINVFAYKVLILSDAPQVSQMLLYTNVTGTENAAIHIMCHCSVTKVCVMSSACAYWFNWTINHHIVLPCFYLILYKSLIFGDSTRKAHISMSNNQVHFHHLTCTSSLTQWQFRALESACCNHRRCIPCRGHKLHIYEIFFLFYYDPQAIFFTGFTGYI